MWKKIGIGILCLVLGGAIVMTLVFNAKGTKKEIKVLSIGHSYSLNSCEYIGEIAASQGVNLTVGVAYVGNCALNMHYDFLKEGALYGGAINGWYEKFLPNGESEKHVDEYTLEDIIKDEEWDYIMFQQNLNYAGIWEIVEECLPPLQAEVKKIAEANQDKEVQYLYNQIWGMEDEAHNPASIPLAVYDEYQHDAEMMYQMVSETSKKAAETFHLHLVPTGEAFQNAREQAMFNADEGGHILVADDSNHANDYGKYLAGVTWFEAITKVKVDKETAYYPDVLTKEEAHLLIDCAAEAVSHTGLEF